MSSHSRPAVRIAFSGVLTALSVVLMAMGGLIPLSTYVSPLLSAALLLPVMMEFGKKTAWCVWGAATLLSLMIGTDKEAAFFYLFLGYYPIVKPYFDRVRARLPRILIKLAYFAAAAACMYGFLYFVLRLDAVLNDFQTFSRVLMAAFFFMLSVCMLMYDHLLIRLAILYARKLRPKFKFLNH